MVKDTTQARQVVMICNDSGCFANKAKKQQGLCQEEKKLKNWHISDEGVEVFQYV